MIGFIAGYWYVWLVALIGCLGYVSWNQLRRFRGVWGAVRKASQGDADTAFKELHRSVSQESPFLFIAVSLGYVAEALLVAAFVIKLVEYFVK
ncbi:MAG: hypothetical protein A2939_03775 [Parcubacteria group bacterium RIFCSPLOWO2_01_FULL_48_18]|nr:MAG: hypothetical protein A3J67_02715 [Parcubacteria group bacterium RIFCSPHIGHO2_02_FULL_48_10b]OHB22396.1 MAG: hypothetical protein A2939_03775 [Parcubacteria group bacterium RIFCSPLOWO2_01_FULL_48_18]